MTNEFIGHNLKFARVDGLSKKIRQRFVQNKSPVPSRARFLEPFGGLLNHFNTTSLHFHGQCELTIFFYLAFLAACHNQDKWYNLVTSLENEPFIFG